MASAGVKHDMKVLFLIINSFIALVPSLFTFAFGVTLALTNAQLPYEYQDVTSSAVTIVIGLLLLALTTLGYFGAIARNRIALFAYSGIMALTAVGDLYGLVRLADPRNVLLFTAPIVHLVVTVLAVALGIILAVQTQKDVSLGSINSSTVS